MADPETVKTFIEPLIDDARESIFRRAKQLGLGDQDFVRALAHAVPSMISVDEALSALDRVVAERANQ